MVELLTYKTSTDFIDYVNDPSQHGNLWYALVETDGNTNTFTDAELESFRLKFAPEISSAGLNNKISRFEDTINTESLLKWIDAELATEIQTHNYDVFLPYLPKENWEKQIEDNPCFNIHLAMHWFSILNPTQQQKVTPTLERILKPELAANDKETALVLVTTIIILELALAKLSQHPQLTAFTNLEDFITQTSTHIANHTIKVSLDSGGIAGEYDPNTNVLYVNTKHQEISPLVVIHELYHHYQDSHSQPSTLVEAEFEAHVAGISLNLILQTHFGMSIDTQGKTEILTPPNVDQMWNNRAVTKDKPLDNYVSGLFLNDTSMPPTTNELHNEAIVCKKKLMKSYIQQSFAATEQSASLMDGPRKTTTLNQLSLSKRLYSDPTKLAEHIQQNNSTQDFPKALLYHALKYDSFRTEIRKSHYRQTFIEPFLENFDLTVVPSGFDGVAS